MIDLARKIWERHELLETTVGFFKEELIAYETATTLVNVQDSRFKICISSFVCTTIKTLSAIR